MSIEIYTDGACRGNPGEAGSGVAVYENGQLKESFFGDYDEVGTNNTAELKALFKGLQLAKMFLKNRPSKADKKITIFSDSQYAINSISKWAKSWEANGWKKKAGHIKNLSLIKTIYSLYVLLKNDINLVYVKGHSGNEGNDMADSLANMGIDKRFAGYVSTDTFKEDVDVPSRPISLEEFLVEKEKIIKGFLREIKKDNLISDSINSGSWYAYQQVDELFEDLFKDIRFKIKEK